MVVPERLCDSRCTLTFSFLMDGHHLGPTGLMGITRNVPTTPRKPSWEKHTRHVPHGQEGPSQNEGNDNSKGPSSSSLSNGGPLPFSHVPSSLLFVPLRTREGQSWPRTPRDAHERKCHLQQSRSYSNQPSPSSVSNLRGPSSSRRPTRLGRAPSSRRRQRVRAVAGVGSQVAAGAAPPQGQAGRGLSGRRVTIVGGQLCHRRESAAAHADRYTAATARPDRQLERRRSQCDDSLESLTQQS
jgi:hypothetical protein